ncbi:MAG TPA: divalent-cation tolerance protein CutA [Thermodesulfobacteriota bacterium]|nr:divalent-cation tolerance protein CutA [Thermodesulfobacteriota bacterium]
MSEAFAPAAAPVSTTSRHWVALVTVPSTADGERIARALVDERLAACVNVVPGLRSVYRWQGAVETADEALLVIKTTAAAFEALAARVRALHPYSLPEIIALPLAAGLAAYLAWVDEGTAPGC